jgi:hypothetical protein
MPVNTEHHEFSKAKKLWRKCEHAVEGQHEIHEHGETYLPKLSGQNDAEYRAYVKRALYYNATGRTLDGLTGMLFLKPPKVEHPAAMQSIVDDITMTGLSLHQFAEMAADDIVTVGRCGVLVDFPPITNAVTLAQAQQLGARPYATKYDADCIINWKTKRVNNVQMLSMVVLKESAQIQLDEFECESVTRYRVLDLVEVYRQRVFEEDKHGNIQQIGDDIYPLMNGNTMSFIPFEFIGVRDNSPCVDKPPLLDLVDVNLSHYCTSADLEHGRHFTGLPTPVVSGVQLESGTTLSIGSAKAWVFPDPQASATFLEFTGQGLGELREAMREKESMMATLGARMLAPESKGIESAQTASIHRAGENSVLASISQSISISLTHVLERLRDWSNITGDVKIELNRDFVPKSMTAQDLQALVQSWQSGAISHQELFFNLQSGDIIRAETTFEDEQERIAMNPAGMNQSSMV